MRDVYLHPTIRSLAAALPAVAAAPSSPTPPATRIPRVSSLSYALCGALQLLAFVVYCLFSAFLLDNALTWIFADHNAVTVYLKVVAAGAGTLTALSVLPVAAKWLLVGRWKQGEIRLWSLSYVRFWTVRHLMRFSPMTLFVGTPLYSLYLRALGAKIGRNVLVLTRQAPVCTDLLSIGEGTVIRKDSIITCYRAEAGRLVTGPVTIGAHAFVGEMTALDIHSSMGDFAQLGHTSSLHSGQSVPSGERWHGSPAQPTTVNYQTVASTPCGPLRKIRYTVLQLVMLVAVYTPAGLAVGAAGDDFLLAPQGRGWAFYPFELTETFVLYVAMILTGLLAVLTIPEVLTRFLRPDRTYPLYGVRHSLHRAMVRLTNLRTYTHLFGDSSYITGYLSLLGYDLHDVEQTGSNFGVEVKHETPFLASIGSGTMVSDGLSLMNAEYSSTSFRLRRSEVGAHNFLGNEIAYPPGGRTGENCLLATKVMIPLDGPIRENVGLLGSPCFEIPRTVQRDTRFDHLRTGPTLRRNLALKKRYNTRSMAIYLLVMWLHFFGLVLIGLAAESAARRHGFYALALGMLAVPLFSTAYLVTVERLSYGFRALRPQFFSIYDRRFWLHERFWKLSTGPYLSFFDGTPFKGFIWRLLGAKVGRRLFDDGCAMPEKSLISIGDDCSLNVGTSIQAHSLEDGVFKSDRILIGDQCVVGPHAFVHYGVSMSDGTVLDTDSFLMKGTETSLHSHWGGNPATEKHR